jgi:hypothetical protein
MFEFRILREGGLIHLRLGWGQPLQRFHHLAGGNIFLPTLTRMNLRRLGFNKFASRVKFFFKYLHVVLLHLKKK